MENPEYKLTTRMVYQSIQWLAQPLTFSHCWGECICKGPLDLLFTLLTVFPVGILFLLFSDWLLLPLPGFPVHGAELTRAVDRTYRRLDTQVASAGDQVCITTQKHHSFDSYPLKQFFNNRKYSVELLLLEITKYFHDFGDNIAHNLISSTTFKLLNSRFIFNTRTKPIKLCPKWTSDFKNTPNYKVYKK